MCMLRALMAGDVPDNHEKKPRSQSGVMSWNVRRVAFLSYRSIFNHVAAYSSRVRLFSCVDKE